MAADPFDFFGGIFCINLDRRPDRWARTQRELDRIGILHRVERVPAVEWDPPIAGAFRSHLEVMRRAEARGLENYLVFEDDVTFPAFDRARLARAIDQVKDRPWDMFFLGGWPLHRPRERLPDLVRVHLVQTHACAMHRRAFARARLAVDPFDVSWGSYLDQYCVSPPLAEQADGDTSDVWGGVRTPGLHARRAWSLFVDAPYPQYLVRHTVKSARRAAGHALVRVAGWAGIKVVVENRRPRIVR